MPVVNTTHFHAVTLMTQIHLDPLHLEKRDFGMRAAIIAAIFAGIAGVKTAAVP